MTIPWIGIRQFHGPAMHGNFGEVLPDQRCPGEVGPGFLDLRDVVHVGHREAPVVLEPVLDFALKPPDSCLPQILTLASGRRRASLRS